MAPKIPKHSLAGVVMWLVGDGRLEVFVVVFGMNEEWKGLWFSVKVEVEGMRLTPCL